MSDVTPPLFVPEKPGFYLRIYTASHRPREVFCHITEWKERGWGVNPAPGWEWDFGFSRPADKAVLGPYQSHIEAADTTALFADSVAQGDLVGLRYGYVLRHFERRKRQFFWLDPLPLRDWANIWAKERWEKRHLSESKKAAGGAAPVEGAAKGQER